MNHKDHTDLIIGFMAGCLFCVFVFVIMLINLRKDLQNLKLDAVTGHHAEYVINNHGQIEFRWKKLLEH